MLRFRASAVVAGLLRSQRSAAVQCRTFAAVGDDTPKKILAVLYSGGEAARNPRLLGCLENELGLRKFLEDRGHTYVVTDDKEGANSQFEKELPDADVVITTPFFPGYLTPERIAKAKKLKLALTAGIGSDHVDLEAASKAGITVAEVTGSNVVSVAEHVVMMILSLVRNYIPAYHQVIDGEWNIAKIAEHAYDLEGKIVGTVGAGRIGQRVLQRLKGFDCAELLYSDYSQLPQEVEAKLGAKYSSLEDLVKKCDVVTINCPLHKSTRGLFDQALLTTMKKGAYLVNTARGAIVDRDALVKVLESGHLAGYAGDVWFPQPAPADHPWRTMPNHAMTPHYSGTTLDAQARYAAGTKEILRRTFDNEPLNETDVIVQGGRMAAQYDSESKGERNLAFKPEWEKLKSEE
ncbi:hypothetical protein CVIRNUC_009689 [Coccomyxa viridis]|uniref:Formate dehydrogenase, mitochondrial n=1 Tax=Coccomyxa viridis TaxID=1274662 RepID=A0AAV1II46_9CHLO|nr:hypothetical protein CVIRNUC_009689 [Coccomyxa viridis]